MNAHHIDLAGYAIVDDILPDEECAQIIVQIGGCTGQPGQRNLLGQGWCMALAARLATHAGLQQFFATALVPVQCSYFEKSAANNWLVPVHQDLSIPVAARVDHPELRGWSRKEGMLFVQPPVDLLGQLVAIRLHLDHCGEEDGPIKVIPGTHRNGLISAEQAAALRQTTNPVACLARRGGVVVMRPLILHASSKSSGASQRRVLHFLFGPAALPYGLRWAVKAPDYPHTRETGP